jgi:hypothetical protein
MSVWIILDTQTKIVAAANVAFDLARTLFPERFSLEDQVFIGGGGHVSKEQSIPKALVPWRKHPTQALWALCIDVDKPGADIAMLLWYATGQVAADKYPDGVARSYERLLVDNATLIDGVPTFPQPIKLIDGTLGTINRPNYFRGNYNEDTKVWTVRTLLQAQNRWDTMIAAVAPANRVSPLPADWFPNPPGL